MKEVPHAACTHIEGMRTEDLVRFLNHYQLEAYLPCPTRTGKPPKYDRQWLLNVRFYHKPSSNLCPRYA